MSRLISDKKIDKVFWIETRFNSDEGEVMERKPIYKQSFFKKLTPFFEYEGEITTNTKMVYRFMILSDEGYEPFYYKREGEQLFFNCDADFYLEHYHNKPEMFPEANHHFFCVVEDDDVELLETEYYRWEKIKNK